MEKKDLRIVYMGTPDFAVETLKALYKNNYNIVGVITMPDKPAGRGQKLQSSPVKIYAESIGLKVLQPEKLKDEAFLIDLSKLKANLQIVVAFRMLPEVVWNMPKFGTFNLHASLLPQYRGAAPINWAIINGEKETGVTTFFLKKDIDTGNIILQEKIPIEDSDNFGSLHNKLMYLGADTVIKTVDLILNDSAKEEIQNDKVTLNPAPKIFKDTRKINWENSAEDINNLIRGLSPYPTAWTVLIPTDESDETEPINIKIFESKADMSESKENIGTIIVTKDSLKISCGIGYLYLLNVQLAGKKRMNIKDLINGYPISHYFVYYNKENDEDIKEVTTSIEKSRKKITNTFSNIIKSFKNFIKKLLNK